MSRPLVVFWIDACHQRFSTVCQCVTSIPPIIARHVLPALLSPTIVACSSLSVQVMGKVLTSTSTSLQYLLMLYLCKVLIFQMTLVLYWSLFYEMIRVDSNLQNGIIWCTSSMQQSSGAAVVCLSHVLPCFVPRCPSPPLPSSLSILLPCTALYLCHFVFVSLLFVGFVFVSYCICLSFYLSWFVFALLFICIEVFVTYTYTFLLYWAAKYNAI